MIAGNRAPGFLPPPLQSGTETGKQVGESFKKNQCHTTYHEKRAPASGKARKGNSTFTLLVISRDWPLWNCLSIPHHRGLKQLHPTEPQRQKVGQKGMQTASQKCPAKKETKSLPQLPGPRRGRTRLSQEGLLQHKTLKVLLSESPKEEKSTAVETRPDRTRLGWPQMASSKQWLHLNVSKSLGNTL